MSQTQSHDLSRKSKELLKDILPPFLTASLRKWSGREFSGHKFEGVYDSFSAVPTETDPHYSEAWIQDCIAAAKRFQKQGGSESEGGFDFWQHKSMELAPVAIAALSQPGKPVRVLDFGGAVGFGYLLLKRRLSPNIPIQYLVIETEPVCRAGREFFKGNSEISFYSNPAELSVEKGIDLLYLSGALQYVDDYRSLLKSLVATDPKRILMTMLTAGEFSTYASAQKNIHGMSIPHWFFGVDEVVELVEKEGYRLIYKGRCQNRIEQDNFPVRLRMGEYRNLLFGK